MTVMTPEEWVERTGGNLGKLKRQIAEAESGAITRDMMDPSTFSWHGDPEKAKARCDELLRQLEAGELEPI